MLCCVLLLSSSGWASDSAAIRFQTDDVALIFLTNGRQVRLQFSPLLSSYIQSWEVARITPTLFHMRHSTWQSYWQVDTEKRTVTHAAGGVFGKAATPGDSVGNVEVSVSPYFFTLKLKDSSVTIDSANHGVTIAVGEAVIAGDPDLEAVFVAPEVVHLRAAEKSVRGYFQYDQKVPLSLVHFSDSEFGKKVGRPREQYTMAIRPVSDSLAAKGASNLPGDISFAGYDLPKSPWLDNEKAMFAESLASRKYDILIVPFQVSGYAVDRISRALMTQLLADRLRGGIKESIADPILVAKSLGAQLRTYDPFEVYRLANRLGVKTIVWCYAGHNLDLKLDVRFRVQQKKGDLFSAAAPARIVERLDLPFDDVHLPYEAFVKELPEICAQLGFGKLAQPRREHDVKDIPEELPQTLTDLGMAQKGSRVQRVRYLQLIGLLFPVQSLDREQLFERSLVLLGGVADDAPAYPVLRARALFHLHRRPAAVAALGKLQTPEEKYVHELLNGNLSEAMRLAVSLQPSPLRLMAEIELSDLAAIYKSKEVFSGRIPASVMAKPQWRQLVERRLSEYDGWALQNNLEIKRLLDTLFPVSGQSLEDAAFRNMVVAKFEETAEAELSPYYHFQAVLKRSPEIVLSAKPDQLSERDVLILLQAIGEANTLRRIFHGFIQGNPESVIRRSDSVMEVFDGHPTVSDYRGWAISQTASGKNESAKMNLYKQGDELKKQAALLEQGQTWLLSRSAGFCGQLYSYDFPRRSFWPMDKDPNGASDRRFVDNLGFVQSGNVFVSAFDRKELLNQELALAYTQSDFVRFKAHYEKLKRINETERASNVLETSKDRFHGHPDRLPFMASLQNAAGDSSSASGTYIAAIKQQPLNWETYKAYFENLLRTGDLPGAIAVADSYPPFHMSEPEFVASGLNPVGLSNQAYAIGQQLHYLGWIDEAAPFLHRAANSSTGSGAEMWSNVLLALDDGDFRAAAGHALQAGRRYNQSSGYVEYMSLLHVMGFHREADAILPTLEKVKGGRDATFPVILGMKMSGATADTLLQWLLDKDREALSSQGALNYFFRALVTDRVFDGATLKRIQRFKDRSSDKVDKDAQDRMKKLGIPHMDDPIDLLGEGFYSLQTSDFKTAYSKLQPLALVLPVKFTRYRFLIPYSAWCALKSGNSAEVEKFLDGYAAEAGKDFDYYLANAYLAGGRGKHEAAIDNLKLARFNLRNGAEPRLVPVRYQLLEACEWLFVSTGRDDYRKLLLDFSRAFQQAYPMASWSYSFVARHSDLPEEKLRSLGIALYLDPNSARLSGIGQGEKARAESWLKTNNPFLKVVESGQGRVAL
jgi:hypothetical protein